MKFSPADHVVKLCIQGMAMEDKGEPEAARRIFLQAWNEATDDFQRFIAAFYVARHQENARDRLNWLETALEYAKKTNSVAAASAFSGLYKKIGECHEELGDAGHARKYFELAESHCADPSDKGPFYHGTRADLEVGELLTPGGVSNYKSDLVMNHIYFTAVANGAGLAAALASGEGRERVYIVEPTGAFENDPNVTNKKFPGNPTRSYRSDAPLKIVGELDDWVRQTPEQIQEWREKLANSKGEIIN